jgi:Ca2+-binding RTX toxin-like protein
MATINGSFIDDNGILFALLGTSEADTIDGKEGNDDLFGFEGNDTLIGGTGADFMDGGAGDDTYFVDNAGDRIAEDTASGGGGIDLVKTTVSYRLPGAADYTTPGGWAAEGDNRIENLTLLEAGGAINGSGNEYDNVISGNSFDNTLRGGDGNDTLFGFDGEDRLFGGDDNDILSGGLKNDTLDGGSGADQMFGGSGDDVYFVDDAGDAVSEFLGSGYDAVFSTVSFTLPSGVEDLVLEGDDAINGTGNNLDNTISGNESDNTLRGLDGDDTLAGGGGDDTLFGGNDNDTLWGDENNDTLNGGTGADDMIGGTGSDTYSVDNVGDIVEELANQGIDTVNVGGQLANYTLTANVENLTLLTGVNGTGNNLNNVITGNLLDNILNGGGGSDTLLGGVGSDTASYENDGGRVFVTLRDGADGTATETITVNNQLISVGTDTLRSIENVRGSAFDDIITGNSAPNTLDGRGGIDIMSGGGGDDTYIVDNPGDAANETALQGLDRVRTSVSYALAGNSEIEILETTNQAGTAAINLIGNGFDNTINGNNGINLMVGGDGVDELHGFGNNDTLFGDARDDLLFGDGGSDTLIGGAGADDLTGGTGADIFQFRSIQDSGFKGAAADEILDFVSSRFSTVSDRIDLSQIDADGNAANGDQQFLFIGNNNAFSAALGPGQLRCNGGFVEGDVNGDLVADFRIQVFQQDNQLVEADFIL